jgi:DNA polymerase-3 subunit alpha
MSFVHLHVHTQYSILDGAANIYKLFLKASEDNQIALAITDHGNMFGVKEFLNTAKKFSNVKPIVGSEFYLTREGRFNKRGKEDQGAYHLILLAKNLNGYKNLMKLSSYAYIEGFYYKPKIDRELLEIYSKDLICTSACLGGEVPQAIIGWNLREAEETILWYKSLFGDDYYLELQRHETDIPGANNTVFVTQQFVNEEIVKLAVKHGIKCIATNDVHFVNRDDGDAHDRLICITTNSDLDDPKRLRYTKQEYLKTQEEMGAIFNDMPQVLDNTIEIANKIERYSIESSPILPIFPLPEQYSDSNAYLRDLTYQGALNRYGTITPEIRERIDFELDTIKKMGYPDYFLIVQDFICAARTNGVSVGPGRGSASGSVVAYCLTITDVDPLKYNLLFERFLNADRISFPDIDIDFDDDGRSKVFKYVEEKYGKDHVAHVITFGTMGAKTAIRDVARIQKLPLSEADRLAKLVPMRFGEDENGDKIEVSLENCIANVPEIAEAFNSKDPLLRTTMEYAKKLEGNVRNTGVHACAVIIGRDDLREYIPICTSKDKETGEDIWVSQYEGAHIEKVGMLKMDFLGLKTLSIIKDALDNIKKTRHIVLDIDTIPLDDPATYELFSRGDTIATFQFESDGMRKWLKELKPNRLEDLIAMNALYRPGPMNYIPDFVDRKQGRKKIEYDLPGMEEILAETYGITVYQEQVMLLSQLIGGLTKGDADQLRKAMGKKDKRLMDDLHTKFMAGGEERGHSTEVLDKIWRDWTAFAEYAFNKSHSTCYALIGYRTAYLKANYPAEFMAATLSRNLNDIEEITKLMDECKRMGIRVLGPDVNESSNNFTVNKRGDIRFGMAGIKGVGSMAVESIVKAREETGEPFSSLFDFFERINLGIVNRKTLESLIFAGALDCFEEVKREQYMLPTSKEDTFLDALIKYGVKYQNDIVNSGNSLFGDSETIKLVYPEIPPLTTESNKYDLLNREKELVGMYLSAHPLDQFAFEVKHFTTNTLSEIGELIEKASKDSGIQGKELIVAGMTTNVRISYTKNGSKPFANFTIEDYGGTYSFTLFSRDYENYMQYMQPNLPLLIKGAIMPKFSYDIGKSEAPKNFEFKIKGIRHLANTREDFIRQITFNIPINLLTADLRKKFVNKIKENPGNTMVIVNILDYKNKISVEYFSKKYKVSLNQELLDYLDSLSIGYTFTPTLSF